MKKHHRKCGEETKENSGDFFIRALAGVVIAFIILLAFVFFFDFGVAWISEKLTWYKRIIINFIGWGISGLLAIIGIIAVIQRTKTQTRIAEEQVKNNELVEKGHIQDRFKAAVEHLGSDKSIVRMAAFNEFYYLAKENENMRQDILNTLCDYLRDKTSDKKYQENARPTAEIQKLLDILFKRKNGKYVFSDFTARLNLRHVCLKGADLRDAKMKGVKFGKNIGGVDFTGAILDEANFSGLDLSMNVFNKSSFRNANLSRIKWIKTMGIGEKPVFSNAIFYGANLSFSKLPYANLQNANFQGVYLRGANLSNADLSKANMQGADLESAWMANAKLFDAKFHGAKMSRAILAEAKFNNTEFQNHSAKNIGAYFNSDVLETKSDGGKILSDIIFRGEISEEEAEVNKSILAEYVNDYNKNALQRYEDTINKNRGEKTQYGLCLDNKNDFPLIEAIKKWN